MKKKTLLSWSSGKDSAWALHLLRQRDDIEVVGLFTTVNAEFQRVAMHAVRLELLKLQAEAVGLPLETLNIPYPCSNLQYELEELPKSVDPCGECGEFHTFAVDGPMFKKPVGVRLGEVVERDGFVFADLHPREA